MPLQHFDPPGYLADLNSEQRRAWHSFISARLDTARRSHPGFDTDDDAAGCLVNLSKVDKATDYEEHRIEWCAFPRNVSLSSNSDRQRWQRTDSSRELQDEFCEWSVERMLDGRIRRVTFTCECPEYWSLLAAVNPDRVVALYREFIGNDVTADDLFDTLGNYRPRNRWNQWPDHGAMHLTQDVNSLVALVKLAGDAAVPRTNAGSSPSTPSPQAHLPGDPNRHSDPRIGTCLSDIARTRTNVTLANPVGIHLGKLDVTGWQTPDGSDPIHFWTYVRGTKDKSVRAEFEVPAGHGYSVSEVLINGNPVEFGAQIADHLTVTLTIASLNHGRLPASTTIARPRVRTSTDHTASRHAAILAAAAERADPMSREPR